MKSFEVGTVTELEVQLELVKMGYQVFTPVNEGCRVDLIFIDKCGRAKKVQVKKSNKTACGFVVELRYNINKKRTQKAKYTPAEIDYYATTFNGKVYLIPIENVLEIGRVVLRIDETYKNQNRPFFARDYELK